MYSYALSAVAPPNPYQRDGMAGCSTCNTQLNSIWDDGWKAIENIFGGGNKPDLIESPDQVRRDDAGEIVTTDSEPSEPMSTTTVLLYVGLAGVALYVIGSSLDWF